MAAAPSTPSTPTSDPGATRSSGASTDSRVLSTDIDKSILRGVPVQTVLRSFGRAFASHSFITGVYDLSEEVTTLDDFISHDWAAGRCAKFITLCLVYNGWPAAFASIGLGAALVAGQLCCVLPVPAPVQETSKIIDHYGYWCQVCCPILFFAVLLWWQQLEGMLRRALSMRLKTVFVDKYCIDQEDSSKKEAGILGLGGFLKSADRLVICWSPRYFTRLWCTYEVASWLHLNKPLEAIIFFPLIQAKMTFLLMATSSVVTLVYWLTLYLTSGQWAVPTLAGSLLAALPVPVHHLRRCVHELRRLPEQLESFSIREADCYCCANNHCHPSDPEAVIPCDRELVQQTVRGWFRMRTRSSLLPSEDSLDAFDRKFRGLFRGFMNERSSPVQLPYRYLVLAGWPVLFRAMDVSNAFGKGPTDLVVRIITEILLIVFVLVPSCLNLAFRLVSLGDRVFGIQERSFRDKMTTLGMAFALGAIFVAWWTSLMIANEMESVLPFAGVATVECLLGALLFQEEIKGLFCRPAAGCGPCPSGCRRKDPKAAQSVCV